MYVAVYNKRLKSSGMNCSNQLPSSKSIFEALKFVVPPPSRLGINICNSVYVFGRNTSRQNSPLQPWVDSNFIHAPEISIMMMCVFESLLFSGDMRLPVKRVRFQYLLALPGFTRVNQRDENNA